jgi:hypothetical protein
MPRRLLLISNSTNHEGVLDHCLDEIDDFLNLNEGLCGRWAVHTVRRLEIGSVPDNLSTSTV